MKVLDKYSDARAGVFCERLGRRNVIIIGIVGSMFCLLLISFSTSCLYVLITRTLLGFTIGLYLPAGISIISDLARAIFDIVKVFAIFGQAASGYLSDILGRIRVLTIIQTFVSLLLVPVSYLSFGPLLFVILSAYCALTNGYMPVVFTLISETCKSPVERARMLGIIMACANCASTVNPAILGLLGDRFSYGTAWIYPITAAFLSVPVLILSARNIKPSK